MALGKLSESSISINSDEDMKQVKIQPFFPLFNSDFYFATSTNTFAQAVNSPIPSPQYKFMGSQYETKELLCDSQINKGSTHSISKCVGYAAQFQNLSIQRKGNEHKISISPYQKSRKRKNSKKTQNSKYIQHQQDILNQRQRDSDKKPDSTNNQQSTNFLSFKRVPRNLSASNREVQLPLSILKSSSFDGLQFESSIKMINISHQIFSDSHKKVTFELPKEDKKKNHKIQIWKLSKQKTKFC